MILDCDLLVFDFIIIKLILSEFNLLNHIIRAQFRPITIINLVASNGNIQSYC